MTETPYDDNRRRRAAGITLMLASVVGVFAGLGLLVATAAGGVLGLLTARMAVGLGIVILVASILEFLGGWSAYRGRHWYGSMACAVLGLSTLFAFPISLIGTFLLALSEDEFEDGS